jgi:Predicted integral membrane protein
MAYAYAMVPFILHDNPGLDAMDAIKQSKEMMRGHKWHLFCLELSFIGWFLLCLLTLGIGFLWLYPYIKASKACFYNDLVSEA